MDDVQSEIEHLKQLRSTYVTNRRWLEMQLAQYGFADIPIHTLNHLSNVQKQIEMIDGKLIQLGENPFIYTGLDLLERINNLEQEVSQLRQHIATESTPKPLPMEWFKIADDAVTIHDKAYKFTDIVKVEREYERDYAYDAREILDSRLVISLDQTLLALVIGEIIGANFYQQIYQEPRLWRQRRLVVFSNGNSEPLFMTGDDKYVHSGPLISFDSKYIAFAYCHDWHPIKYPNNNPVSAETRYNEDDDSYEVAEWLETVAIIDTKTWELRKIYTEKSIGYGEWGNPYHFLDLTFIKNNTALFCHSASEAGITQTWEIPLDGREVIITPNPQFAHEQE